MQKTTIVKNLFNREDVRDYTYIILFLLISSFFGFFVLRPALIVAFSLKREAADLKNVLEIYQLNNKKLISIELDLEKIRSSVYLIDQAMPQKPSTKILIDDIKKAALKDNIDIKNLSLSSVNLKTDIKDQKLKTLSVTMETSGDFKDLKGFIARLTNQRRIKNIKSLKLFKEDTIATTSSSLKAVLELEGYYL